MSDGNVERTLVAATSWLLDQEGPEAVIAAHEADLTPDHDDARRRIRRLLDRQEPGGSWDRDLLKTASALLDIREIRAAAGLREQDPGVGRGLDWIRGRRSLPGRWTDGCSPRRHEQGLCHHFVGGFFSPSPPEEPRDEAVLRCGLPVTGDSEIRFVASATALRCLLCWGDHGRDTRLHLEALRRVVKLWPDGPPEGLSMVALLAAVHALLHSPGPEDRRAAEAGLRIVAGRQRGDGSWVDIEPFQALDVFTDADAAAIAPELSLEALWHGARLLASTQKSDGSWGGEQPGRRSLIAWRTLRRLENPPS